MSISVLFAQEGPGKNVAEAGIKAVDASKEMGERVVKTGEQTWQQVSTQVTDQVVNYLPNLAAALGVLIVGWLIALLISKIVGLAIKRLKFVHRVSQTVSGEAAPDSKQVSARLAKGVFYLLMLIVLVAFFQTLGLNIVTEPLNAFLNEVFTYAPRIIAAAVLLFVAWMVATGVRFLVRKVLTAAKVDRRLTRGAGVEGDGDVPVTSTLSEGSYWLIYLLFLPAILNALAIPGLLVPVQDLVQQILGFLPNLFGAAVILGIGWFVARIVQRVVANLLAAVGTDRLSERVGLHKVMGDKKLSGVVGLIVYVLILVPVIVGSLNALQIEAVTQPASEMLNTILSALPNIFAAALIIGVAYVVARVVSGLASSVLAGIGFDKLPVRLGIATATGEGRRTPSQIAGTIIMVAIVLFAAMQALPLLGFDLLASMMQDFMVFAGELLIGLVIFGFGLYFAKLVAGLIRDSGIANAGLLATVARCAILVLAGAMGLQQMGLAEEIVNLAFGITLGAIAIAAAVAFGIGGRDAAKQLVDDFVQARRKAKGANDSASSTRRRATQSS